MLSFANNECWSRLVFWWPSLEIQTLLWAYIFLFCWLLRMLKAICSENVKQIPVLQSSSGGHWPWLEMILVLFWLSSVLAQTGMSSFCSWDQVFFLKRFLLCLLQVLVVQRWSFCAFSVLLLYLPWAGRGRGLVPLGKAAWLTQSCVGVLSLRAYFIHSWFFLPPSFSVAGPVPRWISLWHGIKCQGSVVCSLNCPSWAAFTRERVSGFYMSTRLA